MQKGLSLHSGGLMYGELFHREISERALTHYVDRADLGRAYYPGKDCDAITFLQEQVWRQDAIDKHDFIGFKRFGESVNCPGSERFYDRLRAVGDVHYLHIKRENLLHSCVSLLWARSTKKWVGEQYFEEKTDIKKLSLDAKELESYFSTILDNDRFFESMFADGHYMPVSYTNLSNDYQGVFRSIYDFLDVPVDVSEPPIQKQNKNRMSEIVKNYKQLKNKFKNTDYGQYFDE